MSWVFVAIFYNYDKLQYITKFKNYITAHTKMVLIHLAKKAACTLFALFFLSGCYFNKPTLRSLRVLNHGEAQENEGVRMRLHPLCDTEVARSVGRSPWQCKIFKMSVSNMTDGTFLMDAADVSVYMLSPEEVYDRVAASQAMWGMSWGTTVGAFSFFLCWPLLASYIPLYFSVKDYNEACRILCMGQVWDGKQIAIGPYQSIECLIAVDEEDCSSVLNIKMRERATGSVRSYRFVSTPVVKRALPL